MLYKANMIAIITGDLIASQKATNTKTWQKVLTDAFKKLKIAKAEQNIYRGDSFQIEIEDISRAFEASFYIKACIKTIDNLDVRMAIGIGNKTFKGKNVSLSTGSAFVNSGETLEHLKNDRVNLKIKTENEQLNEELNLYLRLGLMAMDNWTVNSAEVVKLYFENPEMLQAEMAKKLKITQNAVSKRQNRASLDEVIAINEMYKKKIQILR